MLREKYEYASGGSVLFDLISKANLDMEIVKIIPYTMRDHLQ